MEKFSIIVFFSGWLLLMPFPLCFAQENGIARPFARMGQIGSLQQKPFSSDSYLSDTERDVVLCGVALEDEESLFHFSQLVAPSCLIVTGSVLGLERFHVVDETVRDWTKGVCAGNYWHGDDYLQYVPVATSWGLGLTGVQSRYSFKERTAMTVTAYASMGVMVLGLKEIVSEKRPDSPARNSFPSGHTATAFMGAELMRIEYGWAWGLAAYGVATGVGFLRMYNDRHWLNDVLAGAGIGILSARIAYWLLPMENRLLCHDKQLSFNAFYDGQIAGMRLQLGL